MSNKKGTVVPNIGFIEKVYFNTNLTIEETDAILNQLTYVQSDEDTYGHIIATDSSGNIALIVMTNSNRSYFAILFADGGENPIPIYDSINALGEGEGWLEFENPLPLNIQAVNSLEGISVGEENDKLIDLVYIEKEPITDLPIWLTNVANAIRTKKEIIGGAWEGTTLLSNSDTMVNNIYFNTNFNINEVVEILDTIEYLNNPDTFPLPYYIVYSNPDSSRCIAIVNNNGSYMIVEGNFSTFAMIPIFLEKEQEGIVGWTIIEKEYLINEVGVSSIQGLQDSVGNQNDKLSMLISSTSFLEVPKKINAQDFESEILSITGGIRLLQPEYIDTAVAVPNTGTTQKIWFNSNLTEEEIIDIINNANLPYDEESYTDRKIYYIMYGVDFSFTIEDYSTPDNPNAFMITISSWIPLFASKNMLNVDSGLTLTSYGWPADTAAQTNNFKFTFNEPVNLFDRGEGTNSADWMKEWHGTKNDKLRRLVYSDGEIYKTGNYETFKELKGDYYLENHTVTPQGTTTYNVLDLLEKEEVNKVGTLLVSNPNTSVENIYFNTDLSVSEVDAILSKITSWTEIGNGQYLYACCGNSDFSDGSIGVAKMVQDSTTIYVIQGIIGGTEVLIYDNVGAYGTGVVGWQTFDNPITINTTLATEGTFNGISLTMASENDKLTSLISMNNDFEEVTSIQKVFPRNIKVDMTGFLKPSGTIDITENDSYDVSQYATATVNVPIPEGYIVPEGTLEVTENGEQDVTTYASVNVNVKPNLQQKSVVPTTTSQTVVSDDGYDGLSKVFVERTPLESITVRPLKTQKNYYPNEGFVGFSHILVVSPSTLTRNVTPNTETQYINTDEYEETFLKEVVVHPVTASIDSNIQPENIKEGVTILGVQGTFQAGGGEYEGDYKTILFNEGWVETFTIPEDITSIPTHCFYGRYVREIVIHDKVTSLNYAAFSYSYIRKLVIPNSVTSIGQKVCDTCQQLTDVTLPNNMTKIPDGMFNWCTSLPTITIPNSVTSIGYDAFYNCSSLTSITIPDGVTSIGNSAFGKCTLIESITIPNSVTSIGQSAFQGCSSLKNIVLSNNLSKIAYGVFGNCSSLESIEIPPNVITIDGMAFDNCSALISVILPNSLTTISYQAFNKCTSLTSIIVPESVTSLQNYSLVIGSETNKATITMLPTTPPTITSSSFNKNYLNQIIVPIGCGDAYKSATNWSKFADYIVEASE